MSNSLRIHSTLIERDFNGTMSWQTPLLECNISRYGKMTLGNINGEVNGYECDECDHEIT